MVSLMEESSLPGCMLYYINSCSAKKQVSLLILSLDQFASLAMPYYHCLYFFILSHVSQTLPGDASSRINARGDGSFFLGAGFCYKNLSKSHLIKIGLNKTVQNMNLRGELAGRRRVVNR